MLKLVKVTHNIFVKKDRFSTDRNEHIFDIDVEDGEKLFTFVVDTDATADTLVGELVECYTRREDAPTLGMILEVMEDSDSYAKELAQTARFGGLMPCFTFASDREANWALRAYLAENPHRLWKDDDDDEDDYDDSEEETEAKDETEDEVEEKEDEKELVF